MYKDILTELIKNIKYAKLSPPCTYEEIAKTEEFIGHKFPSDLKELYLETDGDNFLLLSLSRIMENVSLNREYLREFFENEEEYNEKIDNYIFFATNGCGDYYGYKVDMQNITDASKIYFWEHEDFESKIVAENLTELIKKYYNDEI